MGVFTPVFQLVPQFVQEPENGFVDEFTLVIREESNSSLVWMGLKDTSTPPHYLTTEYPPCDQGPPLQARTPSGLGPHSPLGCDSLFAGTPCLGQDPPSSELGPPPDQQNFPLGFHPDSQLVMLKFGEKGANYSW